MANHLAAGAIPMTQRTTQDWHQRYLQQASWTRDLRRYLFAQVGMEKAARVIEIGCGTGAILSDILDSNPSGVYGLDISAAHSINWGHFGALFFYVTLHKPICAVYFLISIDNNNNRCYNKHIVKNKSNLGREIK